MLRFSERRVRVLRWLSAPAQRLRGPGAAARGPQSAPRPRGVPVPCAEAPRSARPSAAGHLGRFRFGATGRKAAISIHTEICELRCVFLSLG